MSRLQKYVNGFAHCLMLCNGNEQSPAYPRLLMLLAETRALKLTFCMLRPVRPLQHDACTRSALRALQGVSDSALRVHSQVSTRPMVICSHAMADLLCDIDTSCGKRRHIRAIMIHMEQGRHSTRAPPSQE